MPRLTWTVTFLAAVLLGQLGLAEAADDAKFDVTGTWVFQTDIAGRKGASQFVFKQQGNQLGGKLNGQNDISGTVEGDQIEFQVPAFSGKAVYQGTISDQDHMHGEANLVVSKGTWIGKRRSGTPASNPKTAAPVPAGAIAAIDKIAAEGIDQKKVASYAVAVVKDGSPVLARGYGYSDLENDLPATAETVYRLGSITKQFTALAIMQLAEQGKLSVDDELTKFLPDYPTGGRKITVRHLLNHTSGIKDYTRTKDFFKRGRQDFNHEELLALFKNEPFDFEPGIKWGYSNSGYYLLGMIIEQASGQKYEEFLEERIFKPLGMSATRYGHTQPLIRHRARGYNYFFGQLTNDDSISMDAPFAAGALVSNVLDLVKWHQALEDGALVSGASYEAMYRPTKLENGVTRPYGYGWQLGELAGHRTIRHGGGINGFATMISRYPDDQLAVVVLSNTAGANPGAVADRIARVMLGIEDKPIADKSIVDEPIVDEPIDAALIELLTGKYKFGDAVIEVSSTDGQLFARLKGRLQDRLKYQGGRDFVHANDAELRITFTPKESKAEGIEVGTEGRKFSAPRVE